MSILSAEEVRASISRHRGQMRKEKTEFERAQALLESYEDLRDDVMSLVKNSGMSYADIHGHCGPCPSTLEKWASREIGQPRLGKLQATLRILGYDLGVVSGRRSHRR